MVHSNKKGVVEEILTGSFDLHVHAGPDPYQERRLDVLDTGRYAHEAEMAGFVLKSDYYPTAPLAQMLNRVYPGLNVVGAIVLNKEVGGLNPDGVEAAASLGARVVWMPTHSADYSMSRQGMGRGLKLTDKAGVLLPQVNQILDIAAKRGMVVASGHVSPAESLALFRAAKEKGLRRLIATHHPVDADQEEIREMVSLGAYVEFTFLYCMPSFNTFTPREMVSSMRSFEVDHCVVTTDFGQWMNPPPAEGMRMAIAALLDAGMGPEEVSTLVKKNPLHLVGIEQ